MRKINLGLAALATMTALATVPVHAEGVVYTPVSGGKIYLEKYLVMDKEANVPNVTFDYAIEAGAYQNASPSAPVHTMVYAGNDANATAGYSALKIKGVTFAVGDTTYTDVQKLPDAVKNSIQAKTNGTDVNDDPVAKDHYVESNAVNGEEWATTKKYARHDIEIDFTGVTFKEPGIYRYIVTEINPSSVAVNSAPKVITQDQIDNASFNKNHGIDYDLDTRLVLDVYVNHKDGTDTDLEVVGYVLHENDNAAVVPYEYATNTPDTKADGFVNFYVTHDLAIEKKVTGNQASHDQYFKFTIELENAGKSTKYDIAGNYDVTTKVTAVNTSALTNPTTVTTDADGKATITIWLQHGQNAVILGLSRNTYYTIYEDAATLTNQGYESTTIANKGITRTESGTTVTYAAKASTLNATKAAVQSVSSSPANMKDKVQDTAAENGITDDTWHEYTNHKHAVIPTGIIEAVAPGVLAVVIAGLGMFLYSKSRKTKAE